MRWSQFFVPTLRETPTDADVVSHQLALRAGLIRQLAAGVYSYLPLAWRVLIKIMGIIREEMDGIGGQEFHLPAIHPADVWKESGRWDGMGDNMFRLKDRKGADMCLGMTHEEVFTAIARHELRSYKQLPQIWYQIQTKFRDEPRPRSGVLRVREFIMKDSYSFDLDWEGLDRSYERHRQAYCRIFSRCGLKYVMVQASSGSMGGSESAEFMLVTDSGEDQVALCGDCGYAANTEKATSRLARIQDDGGLAQPEPFPTPGIRTIKDLAEFDGGATAERQIKTLVYVIDGALTLLLLRGDHELNEIKLSDLMGGVPFRAGQPDEIKEALGAFPGSLGAVSVTQFPIVADLALQGRKNMVTGANRDDFHLRGVNVERDIQVKQWADLRSVKSGEGCPQCEGTLEVRKALEIGHIFKLGTKYSESMGATVLTEEGRNVPLVMGSYGIGVERIMASAIEQSHDENGIIWPMPIAPFQIVITPVNFADSHQIEVAERLYDELTRGGIEVLLDDRDERPGVKFKDADLIGVPLRLTLGPKKLAQGIIELTDRRKRTLQDTPLDHVVASAKMLIEAQMSLFRA